MARVKTTTRAYRLGCGCVQQFSSLPAVSDSSVICGTCCKRTVVAFRYPDSSCAATTRADKPGGGVTRVRCTHQKAHEHGHYDKSVDIAFALPVKLKARRDGNT